MSLKICVTCSLAFSIFLAYEVAFYWHRLFISSAHCYRIWLVMTLKSLSQHLSLENLENEMQRIGIKALSQIKHVHTLDPMLFNIPELWNFPHDFNLHANENLNCLIAIFQAAIKTQESGQWKGGTSIPPPPLIIYWFGTPLFPAVWTIPKQHPYGKEAAPTSQMVNTVALTVNTFSSKVIYSSQLCFVWPFAILNGI